MITPDYAMFTGQFSSGKVAMTINGPWAMTDFQTTLGDDLGVALLPKGIATAGPLRGITGLLVNPNSPNPQLAVDLALFLTSSEAQDDLDETSIPAGTDLNLESGDPRIIFIQSTIDGYSETLLTNNFYDPFEAMVKAVLEDHNDPASAVREACQEMNSLNGK